MFIIQTLLEVSCFLGVFVLNLVCRDEQLKAEVKQRVKKVFGTVICHHIEDEVNEILYALNKENSVDESELKTVWEKNCQLLNKLAKKKSVNNEIDLVKEIENVNIL